ncbi:ABC-F family ATP-binding cassette domain-containing protein [Angustibacter luteus]|uniref:ABC-F family ATP-binding cassette domain-containing protein n=1 Tax=Angustibacter luteus TaxID=658456 RepID=A0ABW1JCE9_9ACTN
MAAGPVNLVNLERARLAFATRVILDDVSLGVAAGDRIGVVGRNGGGKSTLLRVLAGLQAVDDGRVTQTGGLTVAVLGQDDELDPDSTVRACVVGDLDDHEWAGDARVRDVVSGLLGGLGAEAVGGLDAVVGPMSGGERRRIALAKHLVADPDLLLLDEPTNHLDVEGVAWLARHLSARRPSSALVAITHDRWFLDAMATTTWEVHDGTVDAYDGGYAAYVLARAERSRVAATTEERRQNLLRKELAWLRRGPPARTSKPKFRIDAANALVADVPPPRDDVELLRFATRRLGKDVIDLHGVRVQLGERVLLDDLTWLIGPGDRIGVVGVNGSGKSTLLRVLSGDVAPTAGKVKTGRTVKLAFLSQEVRELEALAELRVVDAVADVRETTHLGEREVTASQLAERLGFTGQRQQSLVKELSGGERRRLQLLRLLMDEPNVLLLDEPTNDLDVDTLTALEDLLDGWAGTLIVVSHDRYALERMCDRQVALLGDGHLRDLPGGVEEYLHLRASGPPARARSVASERNAPTAAIPSDVRVHTAEEQRVARKEMARLERQVERIERQVALLHAEMAAQATDHVAVGELDERLRGLLAEREDVESRWLEAADVGG